MKTNTLKSNQTTTKSQQLAVLNVEKEVAWKAYQASGEGLQSSGPFGQAWLKIHHQAERLEQSFVVYRGQEIEAVTVAVQSGAICTSPTSCYEDAEERLYRTADGTYYLWQEKWQKPATVRKLTLEGALLWAIVRVNIKDVGLRDDMIALFKTGVSLEKDENTSAAHHADPQ